MSAARTVHELRRQTVILLAEEGQDLALSRPGGFESTPAGGQRRTGVAAPVAAQRLWFRGTRPDTLRVDTDRGEMDVDGYTLVGRWNADIKEGDLLTIGDHEYRVALVHEDRRYETRARLEEVT